VEAERFCGLEIDDQFVLGWRLHRQVSWLRPLEDAINITCRLLELLEYTDGRSVGHKPTVLGKNRVPRYCGQAMAGRQIGDEWLAQVGEGLSRQNQPAVRSTREAIEGGFDVSGGAHGDDN